MVCVFSLWVTIWATAHVSHIRHFDRLGYVSCTESCSVAHGWGKKKSKHLLWFDSSWHIWISQHTLLEESLSAAPDWKVTKSNIKLPGSEILHHQTIHMKKKNTSPVHCVCVCVTWFTGCTSCTGPGPGPGQQGSPLRPFTVFLHINVPLWDPRATVLICKHFFGTNAANSSRLKLC